MDLAKVFEKIKPFVVENGDATYRHWNKLFVTKVGERGADVTTNFDAEIETKFHELVEKEFPEFGFKGEEFNEYHKDGEYRWFIDPIDGTKYFAKSIPFWSIAVALVRNDEPILGIIYNPVTKQLFHAYKGGGSYMNGSKLAITDNTDLSTLQIAWDFPVSERVIAAYELAQEDNHSMPAWKDFEASVYDKTAQLMRSAYRVRILGSGTFSLSWTAQGFFGAYFSPCRAKGKFEDIAAGLIIASEAGASIDRIEIIPGLEHVIVAKQEVIDQLRKFSMAE